MHADHRRENAKREERLIVPMPHEGARSIQDPGRRWAASGIPDPIGLWRNSQLGGERSLRDFQHFSALAQGRGGHSTTTLPSVGRSWQGKRPWAYFSQLILPADRSF